MYRTMPRIGFYKMERKGKKREKRELFHKKKEKERRVWAPIVNEREHVGSRRWAHHEEKMRKGTEQGSLNFQVSVII